MDRRTLNALIVNDDDLDCDCKDVTIENLTIANVGFRLPDIERFNFIVYRGSRGEKILRSTITKLGKIE